MQELLTRLLKNAELAHAEYEATKLAGKHDDQWAGWYAAYMAEWLSERGYVLHQH